VTDKIHTLWPEICLLAVACLVMVLGLSARLNIRKLCAPLTALGLLAAGALALFTTPAGEEAAGLSYAFPLLPNMALYAKALAAFVALLMVPLLAGVPDREYEAQVAMGRARFDAARTVRAEFYAFYLFSIMGLMLCAGATNLIWLFLALELTSLPTYVLVAISTGRERSLEAAVKYFFLGALGAATFLFGFAFLYGATGSVEVVQIATALRAQAAGDGVNAVALVGMTLSVLGLCFKIAAVPMHFYTPDVYQGAGSPITAMLAFVPKAAGFFALITLTCAFGYGDVAGHGALPSPIAELLTIIAVLTMTFGNVLAVLQGSVKRVLAYSSIAHSGYMLVALAAGPGPINNAEPTNGYAAILFYLLSYGVTNVGAFAVLSAIERKGADGQAEEPDSFNDLRGLRKTNPGLAWIMALSALGLMGFPPLLGFFAKLPLFTTGLAAGQVLVVVILGLNSAIAAFYYLRIVATVLLESPEGQSRVAEFRVSPYFTYRAAAGALSAVAILALPMLPLFKHADPLRVASWAGRYAGLPRSAPAPSPLREAPPEQTGAQPVGAPGAGEAQAVPAGARAQ
jgi:NADH-quinone oxidoreductase subunit N